MRHTQYDRLRQLDFVYRLFHEQGTLTEFWSTVCYGLKLAILIFAKFVAYVHCLILESHCHFQCSF